VRFLRHSMIGFFLASLTLGLLVYAGVLIGNAVQQSISAESAAPTVRERVFVVDLVTAQESTEAPVLTTFGEIRARRILELRSAVPGRIVALSPNVQDGAQVSEGEVLIQIDPSDLQAEVGRRTADLADADAEVREAGRGLVLAQQDEASARQQALLRQQAYQRQLDLASRGVGTAASVEDAELAAAAAEAGVITRKLALIAAEARIDRAATELDRARIALADAERDLEDTVIRAPFDGLLGATDLVEGGLVAVNERLSDLTDPTDLEVSFRVSTAQYARLLDGNGDLIPAPLSATLSSGSSELVATGQLSRVNATVEDGQVGRVIFARLEAAPGFRPGDFVTVRVKEPELRKVVRLPATAFDPEGHVLALGEGDRLERVNVTLVRRQGDDVLVRADDLAGREVVRRLTPLLGEGIAVRAAQSASEEASARRIIALSGTRHAQLIAFVEKDAGMSHAGKARVLAQLPERKVPRQGVDRLQRRMDS